jgi:hypothetical protein
VVQFEARLTIFLTSITVQINTLALKSIGAVIVGLDSRLV